MINKCAACGAKISLVARQCDGVDTETYALALDLLSVVDFPNLCTAGARLLQKHNTHKDHIVNRYHIKHKAESPWNMHVNKTSH